MTRHAVDTASRWASRHWASVQVLLTHAPGELATAWLGGGLHMGRQAEGDLGQKMHRAFAEAFHEGEKRVVLIGTDCPDINPALLQQAFDALLVKDVVLGPALDGGYYLIGLKRPARDIFEGPQWGTSHVLHQTLGIARRCGMSVQLLEPLPDVDRPEDLGVWRRSAPDAATPGEDRLAVVIPTLNEAGGIAGAVESASGQEVQVIVVDGGSTDDTVARASQAGAIVLEENGGRAMQQNTGAIASSAQLLVFLHGDSRLPPGFADQVGKALAPEDVVAGSFEIRIDGRFRGRAFEEKTINRRARALQLPYGDQGLFMTRKTFLEVGGFPDQPIMEDYELVRRLRRRGRIELARGPVVTSGRRWQKHGIVKTTLINQLMLVAYHLGIPPRRLGRWYRGC